MSHVKPQMQSLIDRVAKIQGTVVTELAESWLIAVSKTDSLHFEITVPRTVLEWFVIARLGDAAIWQDWADHYAVARESRIEIEKEMQRCIESFVYQLTRSEVRVVKSLDPNIKSNLEWWCNERWEGVSLAVA